MRIELGELTDVKRTRSALHASYARLSQKYGLTGWSFNAVPVDPAEERR